MALSNEERRMLTEVHVTVTKQLAPWVEDHETRLRTVEKSHWRVFGGATVASGVVAWLSSIIKIGG